MTLTTKELKRKYLEFFKKRDHVIIESSSLIPDNDPTVLFTTAGMHPLVPFLLGQRHPLGNRLVNVQKCIRTGDIDEVGDNSHLTFFEMLGNWSLGDYFKKESINFSFEFLTKELNLDKKRLAVTCFKGDEFAPKDQEAYDIWRSLNIDEKKIAFLGKKDNWWGPAGETGPCGPDTEIFYWASDEEVPSVFRPEDKRWVEIWNNVFMQYNKNKDGSYSELKQKNVDTGLGVERVSMILQGKTNVYDIEVFKPIIKKIEEITNTIEDGDNSKSFKIISDHLRSAVMILGDERGVVPSNMDQGYILRRFIRRSLRHFRLLGLDLTKIDATVEVAKIIIELNKESYPLLKKREDFIISELRKEENKFQKTLDKGLREFDKMIMKDNQITSKEAFLLFQSYGFPIEMIEELAKERNVPIDIKGFNEEFLKHQELSRKGAEKRFKGGLSEASEITTKYHTATHILAEALRRVLKDENIKQKGSNITSERLRYDFNFDRKLTDEEKKLVEDEVNKIISLGLDVKREEMSLNEALNSGAQAEFGSKYPERVSVYSIGNYSKEICMGPHISNTNQLGKFRIKKEQSSAAGIRRIKAILE